MNLGKIKPIQMPLVTLEQESPGQEELPTIETVHNHVYFYAEVNPPNVLKLIKHLRELDHSLRTEFVSRNLPEHPPTPIWLHVCSIGGDLHASLSAADQINQISKASPIYSIVEGWSASGATFISMACTKRFIQPNAFMLIHQLWDHHWGTYEQEKDNMRLLDLMMEKALRFYVERSNMDDETVRALLQRDSWFDAQECIERGLADEITFHFA